MAIRLIKFLKIFYIVFFTLALFSSKASAVPTHVDSYGIGSQEATITGIAFNPDGTKMFIVGIDGDEVNSYSLSVGFDLSSTVTALRTLDVSGQDDAPQDVAFNSDGTVIFVLGTGGNTIDSWKLGAAYDLSGVNATNDHVATTALGGDPRALKFNPDGTKMFILDETGTQVEEYALGTAYDPATKSSSTNYSVSDSGDDLQGIGFSFGGTKMFIVSSDDDDIHEYNLSTGFDVSTASYVGNYDVSYDGTKNISAMAFSSDGSKMFHGDFQQNEIQEYTLSCYYGVVNCIDPTSDKDDVASVESQTASAKKLIQHTTYPVLNRMEWLRRNTNNSNLTNQNIKFQFSNTILASLSNLIIPASLSGDYFSLAEFLSGHWSSWSEGTVGFGKTGDSIISSAKKIKSSAITIGADRKTDNGRMFGAALRFGSDDINFGNVKKFFGCGCR